MEAFKGERDKETEQSSDYLAYEKRDNVCFIHPCIFSAFLGDGHSKNSVNVCGLLKGMCSFSKHQ